MQQLRSKSASGLDRNTNKAVRNLNDASVERLTAYFNECWQSSILPDEWKTAKIVLIPKPGKKPDIENPRPISLTSCLGKTLEHVLLNRWQAYLEDGNHYPEGITGFRNKLSTQDAMVQLHQDILNPLISTKDSKAVSGLDLQSAFDKIQHSAILQVSNLNMGIRTYNYIRTSLSHRTAILAIDELHFQPRPLGSIGTPQGTVISPLLFNLVMTGVARQLQRIPEVRYTIYADDITLWVPGGSDRHIEETLQRAVDTIKSYLEPTGLTCSPDKSELLIATPGKQRPPKKGDTRRTDVIHIHTRTSNDSPHVATLRVLGMFLTSNRRNGETIRRLDAKVNTALKLIRGISTDGQERKKPIY